MAPVQSAYADTGSATAASLTVTLPGAATAGNLLIVVANSDATIATPTGYTLAVSAVNAQGAYLWYKTAAGGETSVTVSPSVADAVAAAFLEYSGTWSLDVTSSATHVGSASSASTGTTATTTYASGELAVALVGPHSFAAASAPTSFTWLTATTRQSGHTTLASSSQNAALAVGDFLTTSGSGQTETGSWTNASADNGSIIAVFKSGSGGAGGGGTLYTGFGTATPTLLTFTSDSSSVNLATAFEVTQTGMHLTKIRFYWPGISGAPNTINCGLFDNTGGAPSGSVLTGTSGTITAAAASWNEYVLATPYALTQNHVYYATIWTPGGNGGYGYQPHLFQTGNTTVGPIVFPQDGVSGVLNGSFAYGAALAATSGSFNQTWYGIDIEVRGASTTYTQTVTTSSATSLTLQKITQVPVLTSLATTVTRAMAGFKTLGYTSPLATGITAAATRLFSITATSGSTASTSRVTGKVTAITSSSTVTTSKAMATAKTAATTVSHAILKMPTLTRNYGAVATTVTPTRTVSLVRSITSPTLVSRVARVTKSAFSITSATSVSVASVKVILVNVVASVGSAISLSRVTQVTKAIVSPVNFSFVKRLGRTVSLVSATAPSAVKTVVISRAQTLVSSASLSLVALQTIVVNVTSASVATLHKTVSRSITAGSSAVSSITSLLRHITSRRGWGIFQ